MGLDGLIIANMVIDNIDGFKKTPIGRIPQDWDIRKLIDGVGKKDNLVVAGPFGSNLKVSDYKDKGVPIIRLQNIDYGKFINKEIKYICKEKANDLSYHSFHGGDLVLSKLGDPIGKTCIIPDYLEEGIVVADVVRIRVGDNKADKKFIMYTLNSIATKNQLISGTIGSTRPRVNLDEIRNLLIPFPPYHEQRKIGIILSSVDAVIEETEAIITKLRDVKSGLFYDLLTSGIDENGMLRDSMAHPKHFRNEPPIGMIPMVWGVKRLGWVIEGIDAGKSFECADKPVASNEWGVLKVSAIHPDGFKPGENKLVENSKFIDSSYEVKNNDLLISRANTRELVGLVCLVKDPPPRLLLSDKTLRININEEHALPEFIFYLLQMPFMRSQIEANATGSSGSMKNITQDAIKNLVIPVPDKREQRRIAAVLHEHDARLYTEVSYNNNLKQIKKGLMEDLLTGKVRVKVVDTHA